MKNQAKYRKAAGITKNMDGWIHTWPMENKINYFTIF